MNQLVYYLALAILLFFFNSNGLSQGYYEFSTLIGNQNSEEIKQFLKDETGYYIIGHTWNGLPVAGDGQSPVSNSTKKEIFVQKYDLNYRLIYTTHIGSPSGGAPFEIYAADAEKGRLTFAGNVFDIGDWPTTDETTLNAAKEGLAVMTVGPTGIFEMSTIISGPNQAPTTKAMTVSDGIVHIAGRVSDGNFAVTDGTTYAGGSDLLYLQMNALTGTILHAGYLGGTGGDNAVSIRSFDDKIHVYLETNSTDLPVTNNSSLSGSVFQLNSAYFIINPGTKAIEKASYLDLNVSANLDLSGFELMLPHQDGFIVIGTAYNYHSLTNGVVSGKTDYGVIKLDSDLNVVWSLPLGGSKNESLPRGLVIDDSSNIYLTGSTESLDFPTTDNTSLNSGSYLTKLSPTGNILFSTVFSQTLIQCSIIEDNKIYLGGRIAAAAISDLVLTQPGGAYGKTDIVIYAFDTNEGNLLYSQLFGGSESEFPANNYFFDKERIILAGQTVSSDYPTTDGSINNAFGLKDYDVFFSVFNLCPDHYQQNLEIFPTNQTACINGFIEKVFEVAPVTIAPNTIPQIYRNGIIAEQYVELRYQWQVSEDSGGPWIDIPNANSLRYRPQPTTSDKYFRRIAFQNTICGDMVAQISNIGHLIINNKTAPIIEIDGFFNTCPGTEITIGNPTTIFGDEPFSYEWTLGGDSTILGTLSTLEITPADAGGFVYTLFVTDANNCRKFEQVLVNSYTANAGKDRGFCAGTSGVQLQAIPVPIPSTSYSWNPTTSLSCTNCIQPMANPNTDEVYQLTMEIPVTGGGTCITSDKVHVVPTVGPTKSDFAGPDRVACLGDTLSLGTTPSSQDNRTVDIVSITTSNFGAQPLTIALLSDKNINTGVGAASQDDYIELDLGSIQSLNIISIASLGIFGLKNARMEVSEDGVHYDLIIADMGIFSSQGTTFKFDLQTFRYVRIFGKDFPPAISEVSFGNFFKYTWAPGSYLVQNDEAKVMLESGNQLMIVPNPLTYYVTAAKGGCTFVDSVEVATIEARASFDGCGPRRIGESDRTPNIAENYQWNVISGNGNITGTPTDNITTVSATPSGSTFYELAVTYQEKICRDTVEVPQCFCQVDIHAEGAVGCPDFDLANGDIKLVATSELGNDNMTYVWSPAQGISATTGRVVSLTDNVNRTYRVTATNIFDPSITCSDSIEVNNPAWSFPVFHTNDIDACVGETVHIGDAPVAGYAYQWSNGITPSDISNPVVNLQASASFKVTVTDVGSGCLISETVRVNINNSFAKAGPDYVVCDGSTFTLGTPAAPDMSYSWSPSNADWQNGTNQFSAEPEVLVGTNTTFTLTAEHIPTGCISTSTTEVMLGVPIAPFTLPIVSYCPSNGSVELGVGVPTIDITGYQWTPIGLLDDAIVAKPKVLNPPSNNETIFTLTVYNASGCEQIAEQKIIPVIAPPKVGPDRSVCLGESLQIGSVANTTGNYTWSPTVGLSSTNTGLTTFTPLTAGTYTFTLTKEEGGCFSTNQITIIVNEFVLSGLPKSESICLNTCLDIGVDDSYGAKYFWTPATGLSNPNIANPKACPLSTTTYSLVAIGPNGCSAETSIILGVSDESAPIISLQNATLCIGDALTLNPTISPEGNYTYEWSPNDGLLNDIYIENPVAMISEEGTRKYKLTVIDSDTGCSASETMSLTGKFCSCALIEANLKNESCNDNGTISLGTDDYITFSLNPVGSQLANTYSVIVDNGGIISLEGGGAASHISYGSLTHFRLQAGSANGTIYNLTIIDDQDPTCQIKTMIQESSCSDMTCNLPLIAAQAVLASCSNELPNDDAFLQLSTVSQATHYNFSIGSTYGGSPNILNAIAFDPVSDLPINIGPFTNPSNVQDYTVRIFNGGNTCFKDITITLDEQKCLFCDLEVLIGEPKYNDNNTPNNIDDDTFTFEATVNGNGANGWYGGGKTGLYGQIIHFGPFPVDEGGAVFNIQDLVEPECRVSIGVNMGSCIYLRTCTCCFSD